MKDSISKTISAQYKKNWTKKHLNESTSTSVLRLISTLKGLREELKNHPQKRKGDNVHTTDINNNQNTTTLNRDHRHHTSDEHSDHNTQQEVRPTD